MRTDIQRSSIIPHRPTQIHPWCIFTAILILIGDLFDSLALVSPLNLRCTTIRRPLNQALVDNAYRLSTGVSQP